MDIVPTYYPFYWIKSQALSADSGPDCGVSGESHDLCFTQRCDTSPDLEAARQSLVWEIVLVISNDILYSYSIWLRGVALETEIPNGPTAMTLEDSISETGTFSKGQKQMTLRLFCPAEAKINRKQLFSGTKPEKSSACNLHWFQVDSRSWLI